MEGIFVDDGSEDGTLDVIRGFVSKINFTVKIFGGIWKELGAARQMVVDNASGEYIIWVDGGTVLSKDCVRKQVEFMEKNPNVGITIGKCCGYKDLFSSKNQKLAVFLEQLGCASMDVK